MPQCSQKKRTTFNNPSNSLQNQKQEELPKKSLKPTSSSRGHPTKIGPDTSRCEPNPTVVPAPLHWFGYQMCIHPSRQEIYLNIGRKPQVLTRERFGTSVGGVLRPKIPSPSRHRLPSNSRSRHNGPYGIRMAHPHRSSSTTWIPPARGLVTALLGNRAGPESQRCQNTWQSSVRGRGPFWGYTRPQTLNATGILTY